MESSRKVFVGEKALKYDEFFSTEYGRKVFLLEKDLMAYCLKNLKVSSVLEIGCGTGVWGEFWKDYLKARFVAGLDISYDMLRLARAKGFGELVLGSAESMPFKEKSFDLVAFVTSLEFIENREKAVWEALRVTKRYLAVGYLNRFSFLAFKRRVKSFFHRSVYKKAQFLTEKEIEKLVGRVAEKIGKSVDLIKGGTTLNFSTERFVSLKLERFLSFNLPFGGFGFVVFEVD